MKQQICDVCSKVLEGVLIKEAPNKLRKNGREYKILYPGKKYCSTKCRSKDYYTKYYKHFQWKKECKCDVCGKEFEKQTVNQTNCSIACRKRKWKLSHKDKVKESQRAWFKQARKKDPERFRFFTKNRSHLMRETSGVSGKRFSTAFTQKDWQEIQDKAGNKCVVCEVTEKMTMDHIKPLSKGGEHKKENIQPLCHSCNSRKKDKY